MRYSRQREIILEILKGCTDHPSADVIYERAKKEIPDISLGTVYRNLKALSENGYVDTLETSDSCMHYDGNTNTHMHFVCKKCGRIIDLFCTSQYPDEISQMGLWVEDEKIIYYGKCKNCR